jgi:hypothetical protein
MKRSLLTLLLGLGALAPAALSAADARAAIPNFEFFGITGRGALEGNLDSRLGTTVNATEHIINIDDCERYSGGEITVSFRINPLPTGDWLYAVAYAAPGKTCTLTSSNPEAVADSCFVPAAQRELTSTTVEMVVDMDSLMGGDCTAGTEETGRLYLIIEEPGLASVASETIDVLVDLKSPSTPTLDEVVGGDGRFVARWSDSDNVSGETTYDLFWDDIDFGDDDLDEVSSRSGISTLSYAVESDVENGLTYYVGVVAVDEADNRSGLSNRLEVIPEETTDFWEGYVRAGGTDQGSFCFVATAAWGSPLEGSLDTLRSFRDGVLMQSEWGRDVVDAYYLYGRFAAAWIADKPFLRAVVRAVLTPVVWFAWLAVELGPAGPLGAALLLAAFFMVARRRIAAHFASPSIKGLV